MDITIITVSSIIRVFRSKKKIKRRKAAKVSVWIRTTIWKEVSAEMAFDAISSLR
jgi:hypothetical protein